MCVPAALVSLDARYAALCPQFIEDPMLRLRWQAYLEFRHNQEVKDFSWDHVCSNDRCSTRNALYSTSFVQLEYYSSSLISTSVSWLVLAYFRAVRSVPSHIGVLCAGLCHW